MRVGRSLVALVALLGSAACANHVRFLDVQEERVDTILLRTEYEVEGPEGSIPPDEIELAWFRIEHFEDRTEQTTIKFEEATPYQGLRELYEVPLGLVSLPLSFTLNAVRVATLFWIPGRVVNSYTSWTFAALNPAMNVRSSERVERTRIDVTGTSKQVDQRRVRAPLAGATVLAQYDAGEPTELHTDAEGLLRFHLLDAISPSTGPRPRKLVVRLDPEDAEPVVREYFIPRDLARRLGHARRPMLIVRGIPDDPEALGEAIFALDRLGFPEYSVRLEDGILRRNLGNGEFVQAFRDTLDRLYETGPGPVPEAPARLAPQAP